MTFFNNREKVGVQKNTPPKTGLIKVFSTIWREFWSLIKLNFLFILFCIPIITIPASITAMSKISYSMGKNKNFFLWNDFWNTFKKEFGKSLIGGLIITALIAVFSLSMYVYAQLYGSSKLFIILAGCSLGMLLIVLCASFYFFPMLAMVELSLKQLLINSVLMCFPCIKRTLLALLSFILFMGIGIGLLPYSIVYVATIMFSLLSVTIVMSVYPAIESRVFISSKTNETDNLVGDEVIEEKEQPIQSAQITDWE